MPHIEILSDDLNSDAHFVNCGVRLGMSPDALTMPKVDEYVDLVAGYEVMAVRPTQHDGVAATLITLGDSTGGREVGILRIRNDAVREAQLEVVRLFLDSEALEEWRTALTESPGTDEVKTIQLDVSYGNEPPYNETLLDALMDMTAGTDIAYRVVNPHGPGGGNPVVAFTGKDRELRRMLRDKYGADGVQGESVAFYMGDEE